jgi:Putative transposase
VSCHAAGETDRKPEPGSVPRSGYCGRGCHHPHVHCVVPAGGLSPDKARWIACRPNFFLPVRVLSRLFRGKFLAFLRRAFADGKLKFFGQLADLAEPARFHAWLRTSLNTEWVVYAKPPFGGPKDVLKYLARYTHCVAISSSRLSSLDNGQVTFRWRDSKHGNQIKSMTLDAIEFIRRFLLHVLPSGFMKIRHFGFLANRNRCSALALCRKHLNASSADRATILTHEQRSALEHRCPFCHAGALRIVEWLSPEQIVSCPQDRSPMHPVDSS